MCGAESLGLVLLDMSHEVAQATTTESASNIMRLMFGGIVPGLIGYWPYSSIRAELAANCRFLNLQIWRCGE